ncbi:MAG: MbnP family copper-binding protein [Acidobacteriota bacterium]
MRLFLAVILSSACLLTGGCASETDLRVPFEARLGDWPFSCEGKEGFRPQDLRFFVHDVQVSDGNGTSAPAHLVPDGRWQTDRIALLDFEDGTESCADGSAATNTELVLRVPRGEWTRLSFRVGVPFDLNHANPALAETPLNLSRMHWSWQGGYKFIRFDATVDGVPTRLHLGSTACEGEMNAITGCGRANRPEIALDGFRPGMRVVLDAASLLDSREGSDKPGCMSELDDPECERPFAALGLDPATGEAAGTQAAFRLEGS